jgi:hypothetical protein
MVVIFPSAAAMNDVERLKGFAAKQVSLLQSLDPAQRQPVSCTGAYVIFCLSDPSAACVQAT